MVEYIASLWPEVLVVHGPAASTTAVPVLTSSAPLLDVSPNPVRHSASIRFALPGRSATRARIYDVRGTLVRTLLEQPSRHDSFPWDARDESGSRVPGGVYFLRVESDDDRSFTRKLTVVR